MGSPKRGRFNGLLITLFLLGAVLLLSCQPAQPAATPKPGEKADAAPTKATPKAAEKPLRGGALRAANTSDFTSLDPNTTTAQDPMYTVYENLVEPDKDGNMTKEGLTKDWSISGDGKAITLKLREGVKFHDGTDFDAAAVKYNVERMKDPATKSPFREYYEFVASIDVVDNLTVKFDLRQPDVLLLPRLAGGAGGLMVSPAAVSKYGRDFPRNPVGTGPFQFVEWAAGDRVTVKRFDGYWKKDKSGTRLPYLDQVVYKIITDGPVVAANLRTGQLDFMITRGATGGIPMEQRPIIDKDPNLTHQTVPYLIQGVVINTKRPPFDNKDLRQAVAVALDREGIAGLWGEGATVWASLIHPTDRAFDDGRSGVFPARDLAKAKAKMAEAGYPGGDGLKVKYTSGNAPAAVKEAEVAKANLAEIGIDMDIEVLASAAHNAKVRSDPWDYQMANTSLNIPIGDPGHVLTNMFHSRGSRNISGPYSNPQVDQALDKVSAVYDQRERASLYQQVAKLLVTDVPFVPTYLPKVFADTSNKVRGYIQYMDQRARFGEVWLAQ